MINTSNNNQTPIVKGPKYRECREEIPELLQRFSVEKISENIKIIIKKETPNLNFTASVNKINNISSKSESKLPLLEKKSNIISEDIPIISEEKLGTLSRKYMLFLISKYFQILLVLTNNVKTSLNCILIRYGINIKISFKLKEK